MKTIYDKFIVNTARGYYMKREGVLHIYNKHKLTESVFNATTFYDELEELIKNRD